MHLSASSQYLCWHGVKRGKKFSLMSNSFKVTRPEESDMFRNDYAPSPAPLPCGSCWDLVVLHITNERFCTHLFSHAFLLLESEIDVESSGFVLCLVFFFCLRKELVSIVELNEIPSKGVADGTGIYRFSKTGFRWIENDATRRRYDVLNRVSSGNSCRFFQKWQLIWSSVEIVENDIKRMIIIQISKFNQISRKGFKNSV